MLFDMDFKKKALPAVLAVLLGAGLTAMVHNLMPPPDALATDFRYYLLAATLGLVAYLLYKLLTQKKLLHGNISAIAALTKGLDYVLGTTRARLDIIDSSFNLLRADPAWKNTHGDPAGKKCYEYFNDASAPCADCGVPKALKTRSTVIYESMVRKEGNRPVQITAIPFLDKEHALMLARITVDVSERKKTEKILNESELRYSTIFTENNDAIFVADSRTRRILDCNRKAEELSGYSREELLGMTADMLHPPDTAQRDMQMFEQQVSGQLHTAEGYLLTKDKKRILVAATASLLKLGQEKLLIGLFRNISEQKAAEQSLLDSETKYRTLYESSHDAIMMMTGPDWKFSAANPATLRLFKAASENEFLKYEPWQLSPQFQPDGEASETKAVRFIEAAIKTGSQAFEWKHKRLNGELFDAAVLLTGMKLHNTPCVQATVRDISAQKELEIQKEEYTARLEKQQAALTAISAVIAGSRNLKDTVRKITELSAKALDVARASLWIYKGGRLECYDLYEQMPEQHSSGETLEKKDFPAYFKALDASPHINADNALTDPRTKEFASSYLKPLGISSMLDVPVKIAQDMTGVSCFEHTGEKRVWHPDEIQFAAFVSSQFAHALSSAGRKQAEEALFHEKERLLITLRSIGDGVIVTDADCRVVMINPTAEQLTGWDEASAKNKPLPEVFNIVNEKTMEPCENPAQKAIRTASVISLANHTVLLSKDGSRRAIADSGAPIRNANDEIIGVVLVFRDVTEAHSMRDRLLLNVSAVESSISGIFLFNRNGIITYANNAFSAMCGYDSPETLQGKSLLQFLAGETVMEAVMNKKFPGAWKGELRGYGKDGKLFHAHVSISAVKTDDEDDEPAHLMGSAVDITQQKENSNQLFSQNMQLLELNRASNAIVKMTHRQDVYDSVCAYAAAIGGVDFVCMDIVDASTGVFSPACSSGLLPAHPPETGADFHRRSMSFSPAREALARNQHILLSNLSGDSRFAQWEKSALALGIQSALIVPITFRNGEVAGVLTLMSCDSGHFSLQQTEIFEIYCNQIATALENVSLLESLERKIDERTNELKAQKLAAETANNAKSTFLANMSHELRTPLNVVISSSDILREEMFGPLNEKQKEYIGYLKQSALHLLSLINDILDLAKVESGKMELALSEFTLRGELESVLHLLLDQSRQSQIAMKLEISPDADVKIEADQRKLKQIIFNLVSNAVKFSSSGDTVLIRAGKDLSSMPQELRKDLKKGADYILISVVDQGLGIKAEDLEKLFKPFVQLDAGNKRAYEGTGLGLDLTKKFIEMHDGAIWVTSKFGEGSEFSFAIPLRHTR